MQAKNLRTRDVLSALVIASFLTIGVELLPSLGIIKDVSLLSSVKQIIQYTLTFALTFYVMSHARIKLHDIIGRHISELNLMFCSIITLLLVAFTFGENALEVLIISKWFPSFAYRYWNFHQNTHFLDISILAFLAIFVVQGFIAPFVEEFIFRGLLLNTIHDSSLF